MSDEEVVALFRFLHACAEVAAMRKETERMRRSAIRWNRFEGAANAVAAGVFACDGLRYSPWWFLVAAWWAWRAWAAVKKEAKYGQS